MRHASLVVLLLVCAGAHGQTMFKCHDQGKIVYSDKPCLNGVEIKQLRPDGGPSAEELGRARMKARAEEQRALNAERAKARNAALGANGTMEVAPTAAKQAPERERKGVEGSDGAAANVARSRQRRAKVLAANRAANVGYKRMSTPPASPSPREERTRTAHPRRTGRPRPSRRRARCDASACTPWPAQDRPDTEARASATASRRPATA